MDSVEFQKYLEENYGRNEQRQATRKFIAMANGDDNGLQVNYEYILELTFYYNDGELDDIMRIKIIENNTRYNLSEGLGKYIDTISVGEVFTSVDEFNKRFGVDRGLLFDETFYNRMKERYTTSARLISNISAWAVDKFGSSTEVLKDMYDDYPFFTWFADQFNNVITSGDLIPLIQDLRRRDTTDPVNFINLLTDIEASISSVCRLTKWCSETEKKALKAIDDHIANYIKHLRYHNLLSDEDVNQYKKDLQVSRACYFKWCSPEDRIKKRILDKLTVYIDRNKVNQDDYLGEMPPETAPLIHIHPLFIYDIFYTTNSYIKTKFTNVSQLLNIFRDTERVSLQQLQGMYLKLTEERYRFAYEVEYADANEELYQELMLNFKGQLFLFIFERYFFSNRDMLEALVDAFKDTLKRDYNDNIHQLAAFVKVEQILFDKNASRLNVYKYLKDKYRFSVFGDYINKGYTVDDRQVTTCINVFITENRTNRYTLMRDIFKSYVSDVQLDQPEVVTYNPVGQ